MEGTIPTGELGECTGRYDVTKISEHRPFKVSLKDSSVWMIEGSLKAGLIGGTQYAEIRKPDGKVLTIDHTK